MRYRSFNDERQAAELRKRIEAEEQKHFATALELKIAEETQDDARIQPYRDRLAQIERVLDVLHDQLGK